MRQTARNSSNLPFLQCSIQKSIFRMGFPSMIGFLTLNVYTLVDVFWMGKLGEEYVAAITVFEGVYFLFFALNDLVDMGAVAVISRRIGESDLLYTGVEIKNGFLLKMVFALIFGLLGYLFIKPLLLLIGCEKDVMGLAIEYGRIMLIALFLRFALESAYTILRSIEAPLAAMYIMVIGMIFNIILDPIFIFGWGPIPALGIVGAAAATIISYTGAVVISAWWLYKRCDRSGINLQYDMSISFSSMWRMIKIGYPVGIVFLSFSIAEFVYISLIADHGTKVIAVYGMGMRVLMISYLSMDGLGRGLSPLIGNILGAGLRERAWKTGCFTQIFGVGFNLVAAVVILIFTEQIAQQFFTDPDTVELSIVMLRITAIAMPFYGIFIITDSIFRGAGDNMPPMLISLISMWMLQVPAIIILTKIMNFDQTAIWWTWTIAAILEAVALLGWFQKGNWSRRRV